LPAIYGNSAFPDLGALFTFGANLDDMNERAATYIDKILKGAKPADLPIELPTKFEFVINANTARELGLSLPAATLLRATRIIE
jgi:putative ABC transport system substrate-binding protein